MSDSAARGLAFLPEEGIAALDRRHLDAVVAVGTTGSSGDLDAVASLRRSGVISGRSSLHPTVRTLVSALASLGPWLTLLTTARGRVVRTSAVPRHHGTALVTRLPDDDRDHLGWLDPGRLPRHLARRLGLGARAVAETAAGAAAVRLPRDLGPWDAVREAFMTDEPSGWVVGAGRAELRQLRWRAGRTGTEQTVAAVAVLDGSPVTVTTAPTTDQAAGPQYRATACDARELWLRLCQVARPDWQPPLRLPAIPDQDPARSAASKAESNRSHQTTTLAYGSSAKSAGIS
jgi:hypothetical protein